MGNPFVHIELSTDDVAGAKKFYKKLFAWKIKDMKSPGMPYTLIDFGSKTAGGGITGKQMPDQPTAWLAYVEVASVKKTLAKVDAAGGRVVVPFMPIGDMGAIGVLLDPAGAALGLWEKAKVKAKKKAPKKAAKKSAPKKAAKKKAAK